jgi:hypothetical protein
VNIVALPSYDVATSSSVYEIKEYGVITKKNKPLRKNIICVSILGKMYRLLIELI